MQFTLVSILALATAALAAPQQHWGQQGNQLNGNRGGSWQQNNQWGNGRPSWGGNSNNGGAGFPNPNDGGRQKGYRSLCKCQVNGEDYPDMGKDACDELSSKWSNLHWDGDSCRDMNGIGLEQNGWGSACQRAGGTSDAETPGNVEGTCSPF
ncbi:hypothetical protein HII31_10096 [Pseudocercospora fuligena]|uniref:Uncharacterized protein n=1 Tax=Pseudocercospora fuligena TaxID=685502 RepID=A0A8H6RCI3_9PEZI|nr:hypothetical protein HII31_10096 [Pseudocercospora fuligena]